MSHFTWALGGFLVGYFIAYFLGYSHGEKDTIESIREYQEESYRDDESERFMQ